MTADIDLPPIAVSPYTDRILAAARKQDCADPLFRILEDYARACVEHNVRRRAGVDPLAVLARAQHAEARAERLAEALDTIARVGKASRNQTTRTRWIVARAISALNGDNDWQALPKPKGFHDALLRDQEVGNG